MKKKISIYYCNHLSSANDEHVMSWNELNHRFASIFWQRGQTLCAASLSVGKNINMGGQTFPFVTW
jgi:hypothetical protein